MGNILLLASYPKSGNTWTRVFLVNLFTNSKAPMSLSELSRISISDNSATFFRELDESDDALWSRAHVAGLRLPVQRHLAKLSPDTLFMKTHAALLPMEGVPPFAQDVVGGGIYIVRNPLDIAQSYARHSGITIDETIAVMEHHDYFAERSQRSLTFLQGSWSQNVQSWTRQPHPQIHVMRYEDMVADPVKMFGDLTRFLGLDVLDERLRRAIDHSDIDTLRALEKEEGFRERIVDEQQFFGGGGVGAWRRDLTPAQARRIVARHGEQMARFGYLPDA